MATYVDEYLIMQVLPEVPLPPHCTPRGIRAPTVPSPKALEAKTRVTRLIATAIEEITGAPQRHAS
jgi:hypothetical protein